MGIHSRRISKLCMPPLQGRGDLFVISCHETADLALRNQNKQSQNVRELHCPAPLQQIGTYPPYYVSTLV